MMVIKNPEAINFLDALGISRDREETIKKLAEKLAHPSHSEGMAGVLSDFNKFCESENELAAAMYFYGQVYFQIKQKAETSAALDQLRKLLSEKLGKTPFGNPFGSPFGSPFGKPSDAEISFDVFLDSMTRPKRGG